MQLPEYIVPHTVVGVYWHLVHLCQIKVLDEVHDEFGSIQGQCFVEDCFQILGCLYQSEEDVQYGVDPIRSICVCIFEETIVVTLLEC